MQAPSIDDDLLANLNYFFQHGHCLCVAAHFGGLIIDHLSEPIVLDQGGRSDLVLHLHVATAPLFQRHRVQGLHQYHLPYGHGGGSKHNGFGGGLKGNMKA